MRKFYIVGYKKHFSKLTFEKFWRKGEKQSWGTLNKSGKQRECHTQGFRGNTHAVLGGQRGVWLEWKEAWQKNHRRWHPSSGRGKLIKVLCSRTNDKPSHTEKLRLPSEVKLHSPWKWSPTGWWTLQWLLIPCRWANT